MFFLKKEYVVIRYKSVVYVSIYKYDNIIFPPL